jgi:osmotically-inducible protein OsmY
MDELVWDPSVDAANIGVSVDSGIVALNGTVKSLSQKWASERIAQRVAGVKAVTDELVVKLPSDSERSDTDIARAAVNALDWSESVPRNRVTIVVEHGRITLQGEVHFQYQRIAAEHAVRRLVGVKGVSNLISVKPLNVSPVDVKNKIERALQRAAAVDAKKISVEAANGKVMLNGNVRSWAERDEAERAAWAAPGVFKVENYIQVVN